ncbi:hypothetical protein GCM10028801_31350 [Nocardioides maradonensis]
MLAVRDPSGRTVKQQTVVLAITYDETRFDPPSQWDWATLLELAPEQVECLLTGVLINAED